MTPLYDMRALADCHLLCQVPQPLPPVDVTDEVAAVTAQDATGEATGESAARDVVTKQYRYAQGEAIVFGDGFEHATETGTAPHPLAFLCFTFGSRSCTPEQWQNAEAYIAEQGGVYQTPWGRLVVRE